MKLTHGGQVLVSNQKLREAFERSEIGVAELSRRVGVHHRRVYSALGLGGSRMQARLTAATARRYAAALDVDPHEAGL